jgi:hypothetical protein
MEIPVQRPLPDVADHRERRASTHDSTVTTRTSCSGRTVEWTGKPKDGTAVTLTRELREVRTNQAQKVAYAIKIVLGLTRYRRVSGALVTKQTLHGPSSTWAASLSRASPRLSPSRRNKNIRPTMR